MYLVTVAVTVARTCLGSKTRTSAHHGMQCYLALHILCASSTKLKLSSICTCATCRHLHVHGCRTGSDRPSGCRAAATDSVECRDGMYKLSTAGSRFRSCVWRLSFRSQGQVVPTKPRSPHLAGCYCRYITLLTLIPDCCYHQV